MKELKQEDAFRRHLRKVLSSDRITRDCISRCRRVEQYEGNLFDHYTNDGGKSLMERLAYSKEDVERFMEPRHRVVIKGSKGHQSIYEGTASLRNATQHYFDFLREHR